MNEQQLEKKIRQDAANVKKDLGALVEDSAARLSKLETNVSQVSGEARENLTVWLEDAISQLSKTLKKLTGDAMETVDDAAATAKKGVGHGLSQFNAKAQEVADKIPDGFGKQITKYPWVAISIGLFVGVMLGIILKPSRRSIDQF